MKDKKTQFYHTVNPPLSPNSHPVVHHASISCAIWDGDARLTSGPPAPADDSTGEGDRRRPG